MDTRVVSTFHDVARLTRRVVFGPNDQYVPMVAVEDANVASPGWVGADWQTGDVLFMGINPGGGTSAYRRTQEDETLYQKLRVFRDASPTQAESTFLDLSDTWISIERSHRLWNLMKEVLAALKLEERRAAFINFIPFRTHENRVPLRHIRATAWELAASRQIDSLRPRTIFALGNKVYRLLLEQNLQCEVVELQRTNGDRYISAHAQSVIASSRQ